ncbi:MAG: hypothetical protein JW982_13480 [Spirochaetes bacterium]|nr:hypothetical protein [Spirochaetota bacterium]
MKLSKYRKFLLSVLIIFFFLLPLLTAQSTKSVSMNFKDVEIQEFINIMSGIIKKNIILDDRVRGKITISSSQKIPADQIYDVMKSILELKGLAVVETRNLIKIVPLDEAVRKNTEIIVDGKEVLNLNDDRTITYMLELKYQPVNEILNVLNSLKSKNTNIVTFSKLNTIIFSGNAGEIDGLIKLARNLDRPLTEADVTDNSASAGNIHVIHLQNSDAVELANVLSRVPFSENASIQTGNTQVIRPANNQPAQQQPASKLSIIANKETNSLIITATAEEFDQIKSIIDKLDIVRQQVLIEALIIEVSADNAWNFGIDWYMGQNVGSNIVGGSQILGTPPSFDNSSVMGKTLAIPLATGFQLGFLSDKSVLGFALLNAAASDENFNVLSTPQLLTVDNNEAELNVADEIPIPTSTTSDSGSTSLTYEYKSVGIKLKITPHITKDNKVTLDVYQEINSIKEKSVNSTIPPDLGKRDIKTRITVIDGKTVVIGGLIKNDKSETISKVPVLGDIPLLGWFFKSKSVENKKTNLLIFITPKIVTDPDKIDKITQQKMEEQKMLRQNK